MERCKVQVNLELGHRAQLSEKETSEDLTHDWIVFVRGPETGDIHHLVEKVVFHLPKSFPKPKRVCKEPPYQVVESGSAGFLMHIEVYFKNKEQPKKVCFKYDLFLNPEGEPPADRLRCEKLTFNNPTKEFRRKLTKAGGVTVVPEGAEAASRSSPDSPMPPKKKTRTELQQYNPCSARQTRGGGSSEAMRADQGARVNGPEKTESKATSKGNSRD